MAARLTNRKVQIAVACLLGAVIVYNVLHFAGGRPRRREFFYEDAGLANGLEQSLTPNWATGEYEAANSWGRNPFTGKGLSPSAAAAAASMTPASPVVGRYEVEVEITGVMVSGDRKCALAGDLLLREGDMLGSGRIKTINRDSVIVEYETGTKTIYID